MTKKYLTRITGIILGVALVISVAGNIYLLKNRSDTKKEVAVISNQLVTADDQIADLQEQLTDLTALQAQVDDLQAQLTESRAQIESLENTIAENDTTITDLEGQLAEQEPLLSESQEQAQSQTASNQNRNSASTSGSNTPTDHTYDNQQGNNDIPDLPDDQSKWPCIPGYEYRPGTEYVYPIGWIPSNGGTGAVQTGNDMNSDHNPCVYDENGNCTVHQHSGY